ncbi:MAG: TolC family protein [Chryseolinea sp.]
MKTLYQHKTLKITIVTLFIAAISTAVSAQDQLEAYVREGLTNNVAVQQRNISYQQAEQALRIARSYFLPTVTLLTDYTSGVGGRSIGIPVGDLLNPVYASLNQMTNSDAFPQIQNVKQNFFPKNFYDGRVRTSLPLFNTDLYINKTIQGEQVAMKQHELAAYRRQLVFDIKAAYFNYLSAASAVKIFESALVLVEKNVQINESLLKNGKTLPANLLRSQSEAEAVKAQLTSARNQNANARKYFNFLLNRDLDADISTDNAPTVVVADTSAVSILEREELQIVRTLKTMNEASLRQSRLTRLPKLSAFLDLGSQASNWEWNHNSMYYLFGVQFSMPLFQGFRNTTAIRQSKLELQKTELTMRNTSLQLELALQTARNDMQTASRNYDASREQLKAAHSYFNLIDKGYQQGVNTLIEFLDARNQLTASQLQQTVKRYEMFTSTAKLERESASYTFVQ